MSVESDVQEQESSASLDGYIRANEANCTEDYSLAEIADEQAGILQKGKTIEKFIKTWQQQHKSDICFKLLKVLFNLFKSEVTANISLRQAIISLRSDAELTDKYERQLDKLFTMAKKFDPNTNTLSDVISLYKSYKAKGTLRSHTTDLKVAQEELRSLLDKYEAQQSEAQNLQEELNLVRSQLSEKMRNQQNSYSSASAKEKELQTTLFALQQENMELQERLTLMKEENDPKNLRYIIETIDTKTTELQKKIQILTKQHHQKSRQLKTRLERLGIETEEMQLQKEDLERELDRIHERIDMFTNPLTAADNSMSPHVARVKLGNLITEIENKKTLFDSETAAIEKLKEDVSALTTTIASVDKEMERDRSLLEQLIKEKREKEAAVKELEKQHEEFAQRAAVLREVDRNKRHAEAENIRLRKELDAVKEHTRQLVIDNHSLRKSLEANEQALCDLEKEQKDVEMSESDSQRFDEVLRGLKEVREAYSMSSDSTPAEIAEAIRSKL